MGDANFLDYLKTFTDHLRKLESFSKYRKGMTVERPGPARKQEPNKQIQIGI